MPTYSTYEAKARFSEVLRLVREGRPVTITYRGEPVAEIRRIEEEGVPALEARLGELERRGEIVPQERRGELAAGAKRSGALKRFLDERGE